MSEDKETNAIEENKDFVADGADWIWVLLLLTLFGLGWNNPENP